MRLAAWVLPATWLLCPLRARRSISSPQEYARRFSSHSAARRAWCVSTARCSRWASRSVQSRPTANSIAFTSAARTVAMVLRPTRTRRIVESERSGSIAVMVVAGAMLANICWPIEWSPLSLAAVRPAARHADLSPLGWRRNVICLVHRRLSSISDTADVGHTARRGLCRPAGRGRSSCGRASSNAAEGTRPSDQAQFSSDRYAQTV